MTIKAVFGTASLINVYIKITKQLNIVKFKLSLAIKVRWICENTVGGASEG